MKRLTGLETHTAMKAKHPDALLLFRVGNFYEAYRGDANTCSQLLGITLTRRHDNGETYYMAGFPHHALDFYLPKLVRAGKRVAICEGVENSDEIKRHTGRGITDLGKSIPQPDKHGQLSLFNNL